MLKPGQSFHEERSLTKMNHIRICWKVWYHIHATNIGYIHVKYIYSFLATL